jgi:biotin carboxylase
MHDRTLLVLGASTYQLEIIETAQRLGYRVVCSDNVPDNPGHARADRSYDIDTTDRDRILSIAIKENVIGVTAPCTDVAVPTVAYVSEQTGLIGPPLKAAEIVCDKIAFREFLTLNGFLVPTFFKLGPGSKPPASIFQDRVWIVKPDRSSGSKGVFIVRSPEELQARLPETLLYSPDSRAILEEFILGNQGTCEGIVQEGKIALACILDRQTVAPPYVATCGHRVPTSLLQEMQGRVVSNLQKLWQLLGVTDSIFDCDFIVTADALYILEVSPRLGGNCIASLLLKSSGFDLTQFAVRLACNERLPAPESLTWLPVAVMILGTSKSGCIQYNEQAVESLAQAEWVDSLTMDVRVGTRVRAFINGRNRVGECFIRGTDYEDLIAKSEEVHRRLKLTVN